MTAAVVVFAAALIVAGILAGAAWLARLLVPEPPQPPQEIEKRSNRMPQPPRAQTIDTPLAFIAYSQELARR